MEELGSFVMHHWLVKEAYLLPYECVIGGWLNRLTSFLVPYIHHWLAKG